MLFSKLNKNTIVHNRIYIDTNTILITIPDNNTNIVNAIYGNFTLSNCGGLIVPDSKLMIGRKRFDGKEYYLTIKKQFYKLAKKESGKKVQLLSYYYLLSKLRKTTTKQNSKEVDFYFYDGTLHSQALEYLLQKFGEYEALLYFFNAINKLYNQFKIIDPKINIAVQFYLENNQGILAQFLKTLPTLLNKKTIQQFKIIDSLGFANINCTTLLPILYNDKGILKVNRQMLNKLFTLLEKTDIKNSLKDEKIAVKNETLPIKEKPVVDSKLTELTKKLESQKLNIVQKGTTFEIDIDIKQLQKIIKRHGIKNPEIANNIKVMLQRYIKEKKVKLTVDNLQLQTLKAINYTIFGTDKIDEKYLAKPELLFKKIEDAAVFIKPIKFPKIDYPIPPEVAVEIDYTTGQFRQKVEFDRMVHRNVNRLFKVLELDPDHPVKVKAIKYTIEDDGRTRYYNYKVTLQNLSGQNKKPYTVELKVPAIVNDKYFKIKGNNYILSSQLYLKPLTKTNKNEVRILTNYAIITLKLKNVKFDFSDLKAIVSYIKTRYANALKDEINKKQRIILNDDSIIYLTGDIVYEDKSGKYNIDVKGNVLTPSGTNTGMGRYEFIVNTLENLIKKINPNDSLYKKNPHVELYLGGFSIPLILYLWQQKGLLATLNDLEIDYEISKESDKKGYIVLPMKDGQYLYIHARTPKQKLVVNGLLTIKNLVVGNPESKAEINNILTDKYGLKVVKQLDLMTKFEIDPVTQELLEFEDLPKELPKLLSGKALDMLFNKDVDSLADLRIYRTRLSEIILNLMYRQIAQAHNHYKYNVELGSENAQIRFDSDYIINNLINSALLQECRPVNPIDEIMLSSRTTKLGKDLGGVPDIRAITAQHRNIHPTQYGNLSVNATPENSNVGIITHHTLTPTILNEYGSYGIKELDAINGTQMLALNEALIPFQHQMDSDRLVLATTHLSQITPVDNREPPLLRTGLEHIVPQLASSRFVQRAKKDGKIIELEPDKYITIQYNDGTKETFDIIPRYARTKRGVFVLLKMETKQVGDKVKANQLVAWTKNFKNDVFCSGKNVFVAMMNYLGYSHEDAYAVTKELAESTTTDIVIQQHVIVQPKMKVLKLEKQIGKQLQVGDVLVEMVSDVDFDEYLDNVQLAMDAESENLDFLTNDGNTIKLEAKPGEIIDIKVYINNKVNLDRQVIELHNRQVKNTEAIVKKLTSDKTAREDAQLQSLDNLDLTFIEQGNHKFKGQPFKGALIIYYIKQKKQLRDDKISNRYGAKGVISYIIPETPKGEFTEKIEVFISPIGIMSRKNVAMLKEIYIGKIMYYLNKKVKELAKDKQSKRETIEKLILSVAALLMTDKVVTALQKYLTQFKSTTALKNHILQDDFMLYCVVPPFQDITFENIKAAAKLLAIPLDEKVYIPELKQWTKHPVPVGVGYYQFLEHYGYVYGSIRGSEKYSWLTGQPTKGKAKLGGQTIGNLDIYALLTTDAEPVLQELLTFRSDDHQAKFVAYNHIIKNGELPELPKSKGGTTSNLVKIFTKALGVKVL